MGFLHHLFRSRSFNILILALFFTIHSFLLVESQEPPQILHSPPPPPPPPPPSPPPPPPPPPPPVTETDKPVSFPPPPQPPPRSQSPPPPPQMNQPRRLPPSPPLPEKSKRGGLNRGKTVGLVFVGLMAMLQVLVVVFLVFKRNQLLNFKDTN